MIGWFLAAETGECDDCGRKTRRNERVYYENTDRNALGIGPGSIDQRLCMDCAP